MRGGYTPSAFDGRDAGWTSTGVAHGSADLYRPPLRDQGTEIDCCTSMAIATAHEIIDHRNGVVTRLSPLFHYYYARLDPRRLGLVTMRAALSAAASVGFCRSELHDPSLTVSGALQTPTDEAVRDGENRRLQAYDPNLGTAGYASLDGIDRVDRWREALSQGLPVLIGIWTQSSYWAGRGMLTSEPEAHRGTHAVCVVGFDDELRRFTARDSRGASFATDGEWQLSYAVAAGGRVIESWAIRTLTYDD